MAARSRGKVEFSKITQGICERIWLKRMLDEIKISMNHTMWKLCDNKASTSITKKPIHQDTTIRNMIPEYQHCVPIILCIVNRIYVLIIG